MKNYGQFTFKKYTLYKFNTCFKDGKIKNNLMGFYGWLIRISKNNVIDIPKETLTRIWNRRQSKKASREKTTYKKVSSTTVLRWLLKLEKAKLLFVDRKGVNNKYILNTDGSIHPKFFARQKKYTNKRIAKKDSQHIENTSVQELENVHKNNKLTTIKDKDILSNNSCQNHATEKFNYKSYLENQEKIASVKEMLKIIEQGFKIKRVKSTKIKTKVLNVLNYATSITKAKALNYVFIAIDNAREWYYRTRKENYFGKTIKIDKFDNYPQRDSSIILNKLNSLGY
ncbi:hypothetical protein [Clostridium botulinum]|nr:hypothetical protein [Clostridium botulinum]